MRQKLKERVPYSTHAHASKLRILSFGTEKNDKMTTKRIKNKSIFSKILFLNLLIFFLSYFSVTKYRILIIGAWAQRNTVCLFD